MGDGNFSALQSPPGGVFWPKTLRVAAILGSVIGFQRVDRGMGLRCRKIDGSESSEGKLSRFQGHSSRLTLLLLPKVLNDTLSTRSACRYRDERHSSDV